ncbi:hypothetical protein CLOM621_06359 [Clostridium sp. M62/1]|nr:hypothetical protein CLOM621_06359 [Clostridium sp. M62/1]
MAADRLQGGSYPVSGAWAVQQEFPRKLGEKRAHLLPICPGTGTGRKDFAESEQGRKRKCPLTG